MNGSRRENLRYESPIGIRESLPHSHTGRGRLARELQPAVTVTAVRPRLSDKRLIANCSYEAVTQSLKPVPSAGLSLVKHQNVLRHGTYSAFLSAAASYVEEGSQRLLIRVSGCHLNKVNTHASAADGEFLLKRRKLFEINLSQPMWVDEQSLFPLEAAELGRTLKRKLFFI